MAELLNAIKKGTDDELVLSYEVWTTNLPQPVFVKIKLISAENNSKFFLMWFMF